MSNYPFFSYSLYGEDAILNGIIKRANWINGSPIDNKTYIDLGCFDPVEDSNTYALYQKGWSGTLVDANNIFVDRINEIRPRDIFLNSIVSTEKKYQDFFIFFDYASSNTASKNFANEISNNQNVEISKIINLESVTLEEIIRIHVKKFNQKPFLVDIDLEGFDFEIVNNYSWDIRPEIVIIEDEVGKQFYNSRIKEKMEKNEYFPIASSILSTFYIDTNSEYFKNITSGKPKN